MPVRNKYNPHKSKKRFTQMQMKNFIILWSSFSGDARIFDLHGVEQIPTEEMHDRLTRYRYKWTLHIAAFGLDHADKIYMKSETIQSNEEYTHSQLCDFLNKEHYQLIKSINPSRMIGYGWIATLAGRDMSEAKIYKWFERAGLNEHKNMPEMRQQISSSDSNTVSENLQ